MLVSNLIILGQSVQRIAAMTLDNICIILINMLISANTLSLYDSSFYSKMNNWESLRPGVLLHALDQVTVNEQHIDAPVPLSSPSSTPTSTSSQLPGTGLATKIQRRVSSSAENQYSNEDHLNADHSNEYDYDKAYDQFVQHYFNSARSAVLDEDSASVESHESPYSRDFEEHSEPLSAAASKKISKEKCKKVHRNRQECVICKNLKTNEKSETCSYSTETEPETYAYNEEKSYKKQKTSSDESDKSTDSDEDGEVEEKQPSQTVAKSKKSKIKAARPGAAKSNTDQHKIKGFKKRKDTSSCIKKVHRHKICYNCYNPDGKQLSRCYAKSADGAGNRTRTEQKVQKSEKKIYKRMVSYSYANGKEYDDAKSKEFINKAKNSTHAETSPRVKRKTILKILSNKTTTN